MLRMGTGKQRQGSMCKEQFDENETSTQRHNASITLQTISDKATQGQASLTRHTWGRESRGKTTNMNIKTKNTI